MLNKNIFPTCKRIILILLIIISSSSSRIFPQNKDKYVEITKRLVDSALTEYKGYNWLHELCKIGPRLSGLENCMKGEILKFLLLVEV